MEVTGKHLGMLGSNGRAILHFDPKVYPGALSHLTKEARR